MTTTSTSTDTETPETKVMSRLLKIVLTTLIVVVGCLGIALVLVVLNETSTQRNANSATRINEELQAELRCLRQPTYELDKAMAELQTITAQGLASLADSQDSVDISDYAPALLSQVDVVNEALERREQSLVDCRKDD